MSRNPNARGFTLIELLFVIAIIGVLTTTAIGMLRLHKIRSMRAEAMTNISAIARLETGYYGENGLYPASVPVPPLPPGEKQNWDTTIPDMAAFNTLGFSSEGAVFFVYDVNTPAGLCGGCPSGGCFTASAYGDSDLDGHVSAVGFFHADHGGAACPVGVMPAVGPPIDPLDGMPILDQPTLILPPFADDY
jgi:prepilin-type N-terminal cleavage/methylation domain-containing protein